MLDHLIDVVVHPNPHVRAWFEEMIEPSIGSHGADERIASFAARAAKANVARSLALKMVNAIIKAEGWVYSPEMARALVGFMYRQHLKDQDKDRQAKEKAASTESQ